MPTIPSTTIKPIPIQGPDVSAAGATPGAFGADVGRGLAAAGAGVTNAGATVAGMVTQQLAEDNERAAKELDIEFTQRKRELLWGEQGLYNLRGTNAINAEEASRQKIKKIREELLSRIPVQEVKDIFSLVSSARVETENSNIDKFMSKERMSAAITVSEARIEEFIQDAILVGNDDKQLISAHTSIIEELENLRDINGWDETVFNKKVKDTETVLYSSVIEGILKRNAVGATDAAKSILKKYKGHINGATFSALTAKVNSASNLNEAFRLVDKALIGNPSDAVAREEIRKIKNADIRKDASNILNSRLSERSAEVKKATSNAIINFTNILRNTPTVTLDTLEFSHNHQYELLRKIPGAFTQLEAVVSARNDNRLFALAPTGIGDKLLTTPSVELAKISDEELLSLREQLTEEEWNSIRSSWKAATDSKIASLTADGNYSALESVLKGMAPRSMKWGLTGQSKVDQRNQTKATNLAMSLLQEMLDAGNKPSRIELRNIAAKVFSETKEETNIPLPIFPVPAITVPIGAIFPTITIGERGITGFDIGDANPENVLNMSINLSQLPNDYVKHFKQKLIETINKNNWQIDVDDELISNLIAQELLPRRERVANQAKILQKSRNRIMELFSGDTSFIDEAISTGVGLTEKTINTIKEELSMVLKTADEALSALLLSDDLETRGNPLQVANSFTNMGTYIIDNFEGGFVNNRRDPGGATNFGVSLKAARALGANKAPMLDIDGDGEITEADIKNITKQDAINYYEEWYFVKPKIDQLPIAIQANVFDFSILAGPVTAIKTLQKAVNKLNQNIAVDGIIANKTKQAIDNVISLYGVIGINNAMSDERDNYTKGIKGRPASHYKSWKKRADHWRLPTVSKAR